MFRILLVEDQPNTLEELRSLLLEVFPNSLVATAETVAAGLQIINAAAPLPFEVAILDFKLPAHSGENPEVDQSLCLALQETMPETLVIHITAFHEDPLVLSHIAHYHASPKMPPGELLHKTDGYSDKLVKQLRAYLYGGQINRQMDELFGKHASAGLGAQRQNNLGRTHLTHALAALCRAITTYWPYLDDATRTRVDHYFHVNPHADPVQVNLRLKF
jgi:DNA-binding NarL/FixJ family response regulator